MAILQNTNIAGTGIIKLPSGTTAQRPSTPVAGMIRYNTTLEYTEIYDGNNWINSTNLNKINKASVATTTGIHIPYKSGPYTVHAFLSGTHTFTPSFNGSIEVLVVGGGGGGGSGNGGSGGGGAGGVIYRESFPVTANTSYSVSVGEGGAGRGDSPNLVGLDGSNSVFGTLTAIGGGGGGAWSNQSGRTGGSGGGGGGLTGAGGAGTAGQGSSGGTGTNSTSPYSGGGGGGAGGAGESVAPGQPPSRGGPGLAFDISGELTWYGGGGGAGTETEPVRGGQGGIGGGGQGGFFETRGFDGTPNTGGGGGGGGWPSPGYPSGAGGRGVVYVRYYDNIPAPIVNEITRVGSSPWRTPAGVTQVEILVVAGGGSGGGAGGNDGSGGGGAGGLVYNRALPVIPGERYDVVVGAGAAGAAVGVRGLDGGNSTFGSLITAIGGGGGGAESAAPRDGRSGGSGGGAGGFASTNVGGSPQQGQGNAGGGNVFSGTNVGGGGGGGAGAPGNNGANIAAANNGYGGDGLPIGITGALRWYAGGGGCGGGYNGPGGLGGLGGGGRGANSGNAGGTLNIPQNGADNTGGGGGGAGGTLWSGTYRSGAGGSGIVILNYYPPDVANLAGWIRPSTSNIRGQLSQNNLAWKSEPDTGYSAVIWNQVLTGNFTLIAYWARNFRGIGMVYGSDISTSGFTGFSSDASGPYFGSLATSGFASGYSATYFGQYHAPISGGGSATTGYLFKWQRSGNTLTLQYSTTGVAGPWINFDTNSSVNINAGDKVICGAGEASGTEVVPLTYCYFTGS